MALRLAYHRPGQRGAEALVEELVSRLRSAGVEAEAETIEEALEARKGGRLYLLMFTRGGHWRSLVDAGYEARLIPLHVAAAGIAWAARAAGARGILLVALRAHRLVEEQTRDLAMLAHILDKGHSFDARVEVLPSLSAEAPAPPPGWVTAPVALLPGRLVSRACSGTTTRCLGAWMSYGLDLLASWLLEEAYTLGLITPGPG